MFWKGIVIALVVLLLDQLNKFHLVGKFRSGEMIAPVEVTPFFNLVMVWNPGISFGMFQDMHHAPYFFSALALIIVAILLIWLRKCESKMQMWAIGFVIGGAIGNVIDRILYGKVADFYDFHIAGYHWPAFNIADSAVFIGAVMLCIDSLFLCGKSDDKYNNRKIENEV